MTKYVLLVHTMSLIFSLLANICTAAPFEPLFRIRKIDGSCTIRLPSSDKFADAVDGKAYPYGTVIRTARETSAIIEFSAGNECRLSPNTALTMMENADDKRSKTVQMHQGKIEVSLEKDFLVHNTLNVQTPTAICAAMGSRFSIEVAVQADMTVVSIMCNDGQLSVSGSDFTIPLLDTGDALSISETTDKTITRLRNTRGKFNIELSDEQGEPKVIETMVGTITRIWRRMIAEGASWAITVMVTGPDGTLVQDFGLFGHKNGPHT